MANGIDLRTLRRDVLRTIKDVPRIDVMNAVHQHFPAMQPLCLDSTYRALPEPVWREFLQHSDVNEKRYQAEFFDCDDFAGCLKYRASRDLAVNGIGLVLDFSGGHAYCALLVVTKTGKLTIRMVEPQSDRFIVPKSRKMYRLDGGVIVF